MSGKQEDFELPKGFGAAADLAEALGQVISQRRESCPDVLLALLCLVEGTIRQMPEEPPDTIKELRQQVIRVAAALAVAMSKMRAN